MEIINNWINSAEQFCNSINQSNDGACIHNAMLILIGVIIIIILLFVVLLGRRRKEKQNE